jgi:dUTP pyrophosphatase
MDEPQLTVSVVRIDKQLDLPAYAHEGDAGLDLMAREEVSIAPAGGRILMPTGISVAIPSGFAGFVLPRSGLALKNGVTVLNSPGLIDSAYRGEIKVILVNTDPRPALNNSLSSSERMAAITASIEVPRFSNTE